MALVPGKDFPDPKDPKVVRSNGTIIGPGKFEGEMYYVPYFWDHAMEGASDDVDDPAGPHYSVIEFDAAERKAFPELKANDFSIWMYERDDGFVIAEVVSKKRDAKLRDEIDKAWEEQPEE